MDLKLLRDATRPEHEATEAAVPLMRADLTQAEYVAVLHRFHRLVCAWDRVAAAEAPARYADLVRQRSRCGAIEADLRFFGAPVSAHIPDVLLQQMRGLIGKDGDVPPAERDSRFLGAMYVLEGSTLGGQYIAHHVEAQLHLQPSQGDCFFRGYGKETTAKWREFQEALLALPDAQSQPVIAAAKGMFSIFRAWVAQDGTAAAPPALAFHANPDGDGAGAA